MLEINRVIYVVRCYEKERSWRVKHMWKELGVFFVKW